MREGVKELETDCRDEGANVFYMFIFIYVYVFCVSVYHQMCAVIAEARRRR